MNLVTVIPQKKMFTSVILHSFKYKLAGYLR